MTAAEATARLAAAEWLAISDAQKIFEVLDGGAQKTRAVGGLVRDTILARPLGGLDLDLATELLPAEVMTRAEAAGIASYPTGIEHGTVTLRNGTVTAEVTTLREDIATDGRRAVVRFGQDWVRDAERRDFTMNALYASADGSLFDPLGGLDDCLEGRVRFIGDADARVREDRLRVFRFFRFSASHGNQRFDEAGLRACIRARHDLGRLSAERIGTEMRKLLALPKMAATLSLMVDSAIIALPVMALRALQALERRGGADSPYLVRLALIASFEEPATLKARWRLSNTEINQVEAILKATALLRELRVREAVYRYRGVLVEALDTASVLEGWTDAAKAAIVEQARTITPPSFPISGADLRRAGYSAGPSLGNELARLEALWIESAFSLDRQDLLASVLPAQ